MADKKPTVSIKGNMNTTMIGERNVQTVNEAGHSFKGPSQTKGGQEQRAVFKNPTVSIDGDQNNLMYGEENIRSTGQPSLDEKDTPERSRMDVEIQQDSFYRREGGSSTVSEEQESISVEGSKNRNSEKEKHESTQQSISVHGSENTVMFGRSNTVIRLQKTGTSPKKNNNNEVYEPTANDSRQLCREDKKYPVQEMGQAVKEKSVSNEEVTEVNGKVNSTKDERYLNEISKFTNMNTFGNNSGSSSVVPNYGAISCHEQETTKNYSSLSLDGDLNSLEPQVRIVSEGRMMNIITSVTGWESIIDPAKVLKSINGGLVDEVPTPFRAQQPNTILCLDSSESMRCRPFQEMKDFAHSFLDGLDEMASLHDHEENVAVVSMSSSARVVQNLTNDYSKVRDAIDTLRPFGSSPFFESLMVCLAAAERQNDVNDTNRCPTRLIFVSDGKPTDEKNTSDRDDTILQANRKMTLIRLVKHLGTIDGKQIPNPIVWVPVSGADMDFLRNISSFGSGQLVDNRDGTELAKYFVDDGNASRTHAHGTDNVGRRSIGENQVSVQERHKLEPSRLPVAAKHHVIWRWRNDEGQWCPYPQKYQARIQEDSRRKPKGISLVMKGNESFRLYFEKMEEKCLSDGKRHSIDSVHVDDDDWILDS